MHPKFRPPVVRRFACLLLGLLSGLLLAGGVHAFTLDGTRKVLLHPREGQPVEIASVAFTPGPQGRAAFKLSMHHERLKDYFLSMREFKCVDGQGEVFCHVPYPYTHPGTVTATDLAWLEHALMFMFKLPTEFGAKLWNGVYFRLKVDGKALVGSPQAIDLNLIGAPPSRSDVPPYRPALRDDIRDGARWFGKLTIE